MVRDEKSRGNWRDLLFADLARSYLIFAEKLRQWVDQVSGCWQLLNSPQTSFIFATSLSFFLSLSSLSSLIFICRPPANEILRGNLIFANVLKNCLVMVPSRAKGIIILSTSTLNALIDTNSNLIHFLFFVFFNSTQLAFLVGIRIKQPNEIKWNKIKRGIMCGGTSARLARVIYY